MTQINTNNLVSSAKVYSSNQYAEFTTMFRIPFKETPYEEVFSNCENRYKRILEAWKDALSADPVSAFGGIIAANRAIDLASAQEINKIFFEVIIAPAYDEDALALLKTKKNRIILKNTNTVPSDKKFRSLLGGVLMQQRDAVVENPEELKVVTGTAPTPAEIDDLLFANILVKHSKSNAIVLAKNRMLLASGIGQTSRVDALRQAIEKAGSFEIINDSYNANPESMRAFINTIFELYDNYTVILGDMGELGNNEVEYHKELGKYIYQKSPSAKIITIGTLSKNISDNCNGIHFETIENSIPYIKNNVSKTAKIFLKASRSMKFEKIIELLNQ